MQNTQNTASIVEVMRQAALLSDQDYTDIVAEIKETGASETAVLSKHGVSSDILDLATRSVEFRTPLVQLEGVAPEPDTLEKVSPGFAYRNKVVPIDLNDDELTVAMADVLDVVLIDEIELITNCRVIPVLADEADIDEAIVRLYGRTAESLLSAGIKGPVGATETLERETIEDFGIDEKDLSQDPTVIHAVDQMIIDAVRMGASDIHIEPYPTQLKIRFRVDGVLEDQPQPPAYLQSAITSRIKIMAGMDVAERRRPQDGKISRRIGSVGNRQIDLRVSTVPTVAMLHGESVVLRILDRQSIDFGLAELGLTEDNLQLFQRMIRKPHGIILATGPTGSGKTTSLYACLKEINSPDVKIITLEDPVEYELEGINQIQVNPDIEFTFAVGLRHILRQDPDKVLIGEIRDYETAEMAVHTSLTGHLVFSTLHTNDAPGAITRLIDMDVEPYLVASTVEGVIAQRLARRVCRTCCEMYSPDRHELAGLMGNGQNGNGNGVVLTDDLEIPRAVGCKECRGRGYKGRIGLFEVLLMTDELRSMALKQASTNEIRRLAVQLGMRGLREDGWRKVTAGFTTVDEVIRLTQEDEFDFGEVV
ncbi:type II/IV secretion system protein [Candidatus Poribacteria bacterium]|nr:type II/IV secretion system protein [Candidatus Poribacteria bacterium]MYG07641.1 type II/IV secretion system protein [Candidatus Poribacteria bacterium]MYK21215.1 type II/IV secretion system protein [Candidatus Poribacteria bacterium]